MKIITLKIISLLIVTCSYAYASNNCNVLQSDHEMNSCWSKEKNKAENDLNTEYANTKQRILQAYTSHKALLTQYNNILLDSQRGWLKYRNNQCELQAFIAEHGSAAYTSLIDECIVHINRERVMQLKSMPYE